MYNTYYLKYVRLRGVTKRMFLLTEKNTLNRFALEYVGQCAVGESTESQYIRTQSRTPIDA